MTFEYGGVAKREMKAAGDIAEAAGISRRVVRLPDLREARDIPGFRPKGVPPTYIPMRNSVFYSLAASFAETERVEALIGGHNAQDRLTFPDARREFFDALEEAFLKGSPKSTRRGLEIILPLEHLTKPEVIKLAMEEGVPFRLTWSCHEEGPDHCWSCEGCQGRMRAFKESGVADPLRPPTGKIT